MNSLPSSPPTHPSVEEATGPYALRRPVSHLGERKRCNENRNGDDGVDLARARGRQ